MAHQRLGHEVMQAHGPLGVRWHLTLSLCRKDMITPWDL